MATLRERTRMRHRTFALGFLTAVLVLSLWVMVFGLYLGIAIQKREDEDRALLQSTQKIHAQELRWQMVEEQGAYVLSAFGDRRQRPPVVRVVGMAKMSSQPKLCLLWMPWRDEPTVVDAISKPVPENHSKDFWIYIYSCPVQDQLPLAVSLVHEFTKTPSNIVPVQDLSTRSSTSGSLRDFTVCVAVLHSQYNKFLELVESIEINQMFGVQKIIIYDYSIGQNLTKFLKYYVDEGLVDVIKWTIPGEVSKDIHYFGQLAAINDCVYRYMYTTKYLIFSDLDEIIVPRRFPNWGDTMASVVTKRNKHAQWSGAFLLRNAFFPLDCADNKQMGSMPLVRHYRLRSLLKTIRLSPLWPHLVRSKYILRPETVTVAGVHYMWGFVGNYTHYNLTANTAMMHHYRDYMNGCDSWAEDSFMWTQDRFLLKYRREITKRVWRTMAIVGDGGCHTPSSSPVFPPLTHL